MSDRNCFVLIQNREESSSYNNFTGKYYHFPKKYLKQLSETPDIEFVYYEPPTTGNGEYFGYGRISKVFEDRTKEGYYFAEVQGYRPFSRPVPFRDEKGNQREFGPSYNAQNAVRKLSPQVLDEICLDGGILLSFEADAHLVQVLGEQLIASERVGILELIKNAFDAGASYCHVTIDKIPNLTEIPDSFYRFPDLPGPVITIEDDGSGMTRQQIENGWLRPASTIKTDVKGRIKNEREKAVREGRLDSFDKFVSVLKTEHKGRIPLGEKGVGRFATHRLGRYLVLRTKIVENEYEYVLKINWDDFNSDGGKNINLDSINVTLTREPLSRDYGSTKSGTQLIIYGGRKGFELTEGEIREINTTILRLNSPRPKPNVSQQHFRANFYCPQLKDLSERVDYQKYDPVFRIYGLVDENGIVEHDYIFSPPYDDRIPLAGFDRRSEKIDLKQFNKEYFLKTIEGRRLWKRPTCGLFYIHLDVWYRDRPWIDNADENFADYLKDYGGISIYRDGINVFPAEWGSKSDWLGLRQRQISQTFRMSYYHMIGNVEIDQSNNIELIDKTNREGMIINSAFLDMSELVKGITRYVELDYIGKRDELKKLTGGLIREPRVLNEFSKQSAKIISNIHDKYDIATDPYLLLSELGNISERKGKLVDLGKSSKDLQKNLELMAEVQDMLTEQAGYGLGIAVALHEINKVTSNFYYGILEIIKNGKFDKLKLEDLKDTSAALESEILRISPLRALRNERPTLYKVSQSINYVQSVFKWKFDKIGIEFSFAGGDFSVSARYGALNQILTNLFDNSCYWLDNPDLPTKRIHVEVDAVSRTIIVADNGPGLAESILPYLFQPGYSLKEPPSGLGLYICKHYMNLMKKRGDIYLVKERDRLPNLQGAQFLLDFSKVIGIDEE